MNLTALQAAVLRRLGSDYEAGALTEVINASLHDLEVEADWYWYEVEANIAALLNTQSYAVPADWKRTHSLQIAGDPPLTLVDKAEFDARFYTTAWTGRPRYWSYWKGFIYLGPTPDSAYTVVHRYFKVEPELAAGGDTPLLPARYHPAVVDGALLLAWDRAPGEQDAARIRAEKSLASWKARMLREATQQGNTYTNLHTVTAPVATAPVHP